MALPFLILSTASRAPALAAGPSVYRPGGAHRTLSAAAAVAIAGGVGASLMLALVAPTIVKDIGTTEIWNVPADPVPPKPEPQVDKPEEPSRSVITTTPNKPLVDSDTTLEVIPDPLPPLDPGPVVGTGTTGGGIVLPEPPHVPVFRDATRDPRFAGRFQPDYPASRIRDGIEGRCPVTVTIAPSGRVSDVASNGCDDEAFFAATQRQALRHWRFQPATRDGVPVQSTQSLTVTFRLDQ